MKILQPIRKAIRFITYLGVKDNLAFSDAKNIKAVNATTIGIMIFTLPYPPLYFYLQIQMNPQLFFVLPVTILGFIAVLWLNNRGRYMKAKIMLIVNSMIMLLYISIILGREPGMYLYIFPALFIPFFIFSRSEKRLLIITQMITFLLFISVHLYFHFAGALIQTTSNKIKIFYYVNISFLYFFFIYIGTYFQSITNKFETSLQQEKEKSDRLLKSILPDQIAEELKQAQKTQPRYYENATVMFTDFVGFTQIAEQLSPQELVKELDGCFSYFDSLMEQFGTEKLKTIGDAYMCVAGIPEAKPTHAVDMVMVALEIRRFINQLQALREENGLPSWQLRIGLHSGHLIAGVIGEKKFAYDVWGDTVNIAARMESSGATGKINISAETYRLVKNFFVCSYRGKIKAKNKGEVEMYFVEDILPQLREEDEFGAPNEKFRKLYQKLANS